MIAKMIGARAEQGVDADKFFLETGGWDTYVDVEDNLNNLFRDNDASFLAFSGVMKVKGTWNSVSVKEISDFARTLSPNTGRGYLTMHEEFQFCCNSLLFYLPQPDTFAFFHVSAYRSGNYMMFGGDVKGRQIVGTYPDNLTDDGDLSLGAGRMIPATSWGAVNITLAEWAGAEASDLDWICPNKDNFPESHFIE
ncbi:hypothetical protein ACHAW6_012940 [Cyclotella cf. meneghiniana]